MTEEASYNKNFNMLPCYMSYIKLFFLYLNLTAVPSFFKQDILPWKIIKSLLT